uniref:Late embryogenesis abundant protein LEA-2 subgroup domain-containing protein n=1 Tax=Kalanchoe fedtschenkoi TaxID=63787 RepID=A0A7N0VJF9_KALFE
MSHVETNPYFVQGTQHPRDGPDQPHPTAPPHGQGPRHDPPHPTDQHPRFMLPAQQEHGTHNAPDHHEPQPQSQGPQHIHIPHPQAPHSFQIPLQQGKPKKSKDKRGQRQTGQHHSQLPHIYVPHDIRRQEPQHRQQQQQQRHQPHGLRVPHPRRTRPVTWFVAFFCAIFWLIIFLGGLIVLVIYFIYRPHSPQYELSQVALNAAYLDTGNLLNADVRLLANFTNINKKVKVEFKDMIMNLYYGKTLIATQYIKPFAETRREHVLLDIHMVSSQVQLPLEDSRRLARQLFNNRVSLQVRGYFRTRYNLGSLLRYTYTLYSNCRVNVTGPPNGVLVGKSCRTKR